MSLATTVPAARVRSWLRRAQRTEGRSGWLSDVYFGLLLVVTMVAFAAGLFRFLGRLALSTPARHGQAGGALLAIGLVWYAVLLAGAGQLGPVSIGQASLNWLATSSVGRRGLLWPAALSGYGLGLVAGALYGGLVLATVPPPHPNGALILLAGGLGGAIAAAGAVLCQTLLADGRRTLTAISAVLLGAAIVVVALVVAGVQLHPPGAFAASPVAAVVIGVAAAAILAAMLVLLSRLRLASLAYGAESMQSAVTAVVLLDPGMAARAAEERAWVRRRVRATGLPRWHGRLALLAHDLRLVTRQPVRVALAIASAVLPFLVASVVNRPIVAVVSWLVFGLLATGLAGSNLRRDRDFPELGRLFGISPLWMVVGRAVVPFGVALAWSALSLQLVGAARVGGGGLGWLAIGAAAAPALTIGAIRAARRTAIRHDMPMVDVVGTVLPTGPLRWASTGFDLAVPLLAPTLVAIGQGRPSATAVGFQVAFSVLGGAWYLRNQNR